MSRWRLDMNMAALISFIGGLVSICGCHTRTAVGGLAGAAGNGGDGGGGGAQMDAAAGCSASPGAGPGSQPAAALSFQPAVDYSLDFYPYSMAVGDMNGDGKPDLVLAGETILAVFFNKGDGSFVPVTSAIPNRLQALAVGDLNGDGRPDVVGLNGESPVSVLLNQGTGVLAAPVNYAVAQPFGVALGDLNGDGRNDIIIPNSMGVTVLSNTGGGTFAAASYPTAPPPAFPNAALGVAVADVNGDCKLDVVAIVYNQGIAVFLNKGDGALKPATSYSIGDIPGVIALGDLNGDGKVDIAAGKDGLVDVLLNYGDGSFTAAIEYSGDMPDGGFATIASLALGDLNGDGKSDVAFSDATAIGVLLNQGADAFSTASFYNVPFPPGQLLLGDLNGDGKLDMVATFASPDRFTAGLRVFLNDSR
jgi:hypothetical protein